jgi:hypothetical protein
MAVCRLRLLVPWRDYSHPESVLPQPVLRVIPCGSLSAKAASAVARDVSDLNQFCAASASGILDGSLSAKAASAEARYSHPESVLPQPVLRVINHGSLSAKAASALARYLRLNQFCRSQCFG